MKKINSRKARGLLLSPPHPIKKSSGSQSQIPISLLTASSGLIGHSDLRFLDLSLGRDADSLNHTLSDFKPDFVGISTMTYNYSSTKELISRLKKLDRSLKIVIGGIHAKSVGHEIFETSLADYVVLGEGEDVLRRFIENELDAKGIEGIVSRSGEGSNKITMASEIDYVPPYQLVGIRKYNNTFFPLITQRGCVFGCGFCSMSNDSVRFRSEESIAHELDYLYRNGVRNIFISSDSFNLQPRRAKSLLRMIYEEYKDNISFMVNLRGNAIDPELAEILRMVGCKRAFIGIESGSDEILSVINKGENTEEMAKGVRRLKENGIETNCSFIIGLPGESRKTVEETIKFAKRLNPDIAVFNVYVPFPGTPIYENEDKYDIQIHDRKWYLKSIPNRPIISTSNLSSEKIQKLTSECYRRFYG